MKKIIAVLFLLLIFSANLLTGTTPVSANSKFWSVQSIDTMKFSRDASRSNLSQNQINEEVKNIAKTGATHIAIGTPYDAEFLNILQNWIFAARTNQLKVWFRGNWSGWEGWFDHPKNLTREKHIELTKKFILENSNFFEDGDIFTPCPECENGGAGDPRLTGDASGFKKFMIDEYKATKEAFQKINKKVISNYASMNGDVAELIMDKETTKQMDGVVVIDHYVETPDKLISDIRKMAQQSGGKIVLGEFGSPIPDITGPQTEKEQSEWIKESLGKLILLPEVIGINYWADIGASTSIWNEDRSPRLAQKTVELFFNPPLLQGKVISNLQDPAKDVRVDYLSRQTKTDHLGRFEIPYVDPQTKLTFTRGDYQKETIVSDIIKNKNKVNIPSNSLNLWQRLINFLKSVKIL